MSADLEPTELRGHGLKASPEPEGLGGMFSGE